MEDLVKRLDCVRFQPFDGVVVYRDENGNEETLWDVVTSAIDTIESLVSENNRLKTENKPRWIPVTERLPEDDLPKGSTAKQIKVIVAYKRKNCSWVIRTQLRQKGRWYGRPDEWDWSVSDPISHWIPLPDSPKEGDV